MSGDLGEKGRVSVAGTGAGSCTLSTQPLEAACRVTYDAAQPSIRLGVVFCPEDLTGYAGVSSRSPLAVRWLPWRESFCGNGISCTTVRDRTVNALERRSASLKIESQLSIDKELASIKRMTYSGRRLMTPRARAPAAHLGIYLRSKVLRSACEFSANEMGAWPISPAHALASP